MLDDVYIDFAGVGPHTPGTAKADFLAANTSAALCTRLGLTTGLEPGYLAVVTETGPLAARKWLITSIAAEADDVIPRGLR